MPVSNDHVRYISATVNSASPPGLSSDRIAFQLDIRPEQMVAAMACLRGCPLLQLKQISIIATDEHNHDAGVYHHKTVTGEERKQIIQAESRLAIANAASQISAMVAEALRQPNSVLEVLDIVGLKWSLKCWTVLSRSMHRSNALTELCLNDTELGDDAAEVLAKGLADRRALRRLQLCGCQLSDRGAIAIIEVLQGQGDRYVTRGWSHSLRRSELDTSVDSVISAGVIRSLAFSSNNLSNTTTAALVSAIRLNPQLQEIYLRNNKIGRMGSDSLWNVCESCKTVMRLDLRNNVQKVDWIFCSEAPGKPPVLLPGSSNHNLEARPQSVKVSPLKNKYGSCVAGGGVNVIYDENTSRLRFRSSPTGKLRKSTGNINIHSRKFAEFNRNHSKVTVSMNDLECYAKIPGRKSRVSFRSPPAKATMLDRAGSVILDRARSKGVKGLEDELLEQVTARLEAETQAARFVHEIQGLKQHIQLLNRQLVDLQEAVDSNQDDSDLDALEQVAATLNALLTDLEIKKHEQEQQRRSINLAPQQDDISAQVEDRLREKWQM